MLPIGLRSVNRSNFLRTTAVLAAAISLLPFAIAQNGSKAANKPAFRDGVVLVAFQPSSSREQQEKLIAQLGAVDLRVIGQNTHVLQVPRGRVMQAIHLLQSSEAVRYAEPDFRHSLNGSTPNDPSFLKQWAFQNTGQTVNGVTGTARADEGAARTWAVTTGSTSIVVAVVDTGIDYNHPDLAPNVWSNPGGINGCPAGTHGYNVLNSTCDPMDDDTVYNGHGTHVAGIIGAATNNSTGVAGLNWQTSLLGVKWVDANGDGYTSDLISALDWASQARQAGVNIRIVNDSQTWPGTAASQALSDEIDALASNDILFVTAAGNTAQNNDTTPRYPCVYDRPNQICAAASDQNDKLWSSSNYGARTVDLAAPGVNILSTLRNGSYGYISGCSMSAAQVSGAAALVLATANLSVSELKSILLQAVDPLPAFASTTRTGGRLDICKAIEGCESSAPVNTSPPTISGTPAVSRQLTASNGSWSGNPTSFAYQWQRCGASGCSAIAGATASTYTIVAADAGSTLRVAVTASNAAGSNTAFSNATSTVQGSNSGFGMVQSAAIEGSGVGSLMVSFGAPNTAGNMIIAVVRASSATQSVTISDTAGNHYSDAVHQVQINDGHQIHIFYAAKVAAGTNTVTATFSGTNSHPWLGIFEYSGLSQTNPLDRTASAQGSGTLPSTGSTVQTRSSNELVFSALGLPSSSAAVVTAATGFTLEQQDTHSPGSRAATEDELVTSQGALNASYALSASASWSAAVATFSTTPITSGSPLTITTTSLPGGVVGASYNAALNASGGVAPYSWSISGTLPPGLQLSTSGVINGTPTASGTWNFTVQVTDANNATATAALSLSVTSSSGQPIALIQSKVAEGTGANSLSAAFPGANTAGNLIVAFVRMSSTSQTVTVSDTAGNSYAQAVTQSQSADGHQTFIYFARNIKGGANTVSAAFSGTNNHPWLAIYEFSGLGATAPLDRVASAQGSGSSVSTGLTATTSSAPELVFAGVGLPSSSTVSVTAGSGFVILQSAGSSRAATEYADAHAVGQYAGTFSLSGAANWSAVVATFKP